MEQYYKEHYIIVDGLRDPATNLFIAGILIQTFRDGPYYSVRWQYPADGGLPSQHEAEVAGIAWAIEWINGRFGRYVQRKCPRCGKLFAVTLSQPNASHPTLAIVGSCDRCGYQIDWALIHGGRHPQQHRTSLSVR